MNIKRKSEYIGALGALLVHVAVIALLLLVHFAIPKPDEEAGGIPVMMGNVDMAKGEFDPSTMMDVDILPEEASTTQPQPEVPSEQDLITQADEETVAVKPKKEAKKETPKEVKRPQKTEAQKTAEAKKQAEAKAERERKAAAEVANKRVAGAFGKGSQMGGSRGSADSGDGVEGSRNGNSSTGAKSGVGGYGTFSLGGRSIGAGGLPRPAYNVQEEGRVVVTITVNPTGQVIATSINRQTNTVNATLRRAAEEAAKRARFNEVDGINNQTGTITYYFNLK